MRNAHIFRVSNENEYERRTLIEAWPMADKFVSFI